MKENKMKTTSKINRYRSAYWVRLAILIAFLAGASAMPLSIAYGDESGVSFWLPGQYASLAALPPDPGFNLTTTFYAYHGDAGADKTFSRGRDLEGNLKATSPLLFLTPAWAPDIKLLGGQPSLSLTVVGGYQQVSGDVTLFPSGRQVSRDDSLWGLGDLYPMTNISWNKGSSNWMAYLTGDIPVGSYDQDRLANFGIGHGAIDLGAAYTYLNHKTGLEFSTTLGFTYNFQNTDTNYTNGVDSHLDWALSQFLSEDFHVGVVGYVYCQLTADNYPTNGIAGQARLRALGNFESDVGGVGPEIGYLFKIGDKQAYANLRGYYEYWAEHRLKGYTVFLNVQIPL
jgi:hypothetical protein